MPRRRRFSPVAAAVVTPRDDDAFLAEVVVALEREGSRPRRTWPDCCAAGRRFTRWLSGRGLDLDLVRSCCDRDAAGKPVVPTVLVIAYVADELLRDDVKPGSAENAVGRLVSWFRGTGWDVAHLRRGGEGLALLSALVRNHRHDDVEAHVRVPARPVVAEWVERIAASIEVARDDPSIQPLWVDAMVTYHLVTFYLAMRSRESATHLRWGWISDRGVRVEVHTPGGYVLKQQARPETIVMPANPDPDGLCPVAQLRRWRQCCIDADIPVDDDALVFPAVRKVLPEHCLTANQPWWGVRLWVADPIGDVATAATQQGCDTETVQCRVESARRSHRNRYAREWGAFAIAADFEPRHRFEKISSHGLRRGTATTMRANGAPSAAIAKHLRHLRGSMTDLYIEASELAGPDTRPLFAIDELRRVSDPDVALTELFDGDATLTGHDGRCEVVHHGEACGRDFMSHIDVGEGPVPACEAHVARAKKGLRGDALTIPINSHRLAPNCEVPHHGEVCGEDTNGGGHVEVDGVPLSACRGHANRFREGACGDELTRPLHFRRLSGRCEVLHRGVVCGRDTSDGRRVTIAGTRVECCAGHRQRWQAGKRGEVFTQPIGSQPLQGSCEVAHHGAACGRPSKHRIKIEGVLVECCPGHRTRWVTAKRGDSFSAPIREGRRRP